MKAIVLLLPVLIPFLSGIVLFFAPFQRSGMRDRFTAVTVLINSLVIPFLLFTRPSDVLRLIPLSENISLSLRLDGLGSVFLALIAFLWPLATFYSFEYMEHEEHLSRFFAFYTMCYGITAGVALSANLITLYFF